MTRPGTEIQCASAAIGREVKNHGRKSENLPRLHRNLATARLAEHIKRITDAAPPLNPEQIERLTGLLRVSAS